MKIPALSPKIPVFFFKNPDSVLYVGNKKQSPGTKHGNKIWSPGTKLGNKNMSPGTNLGNKNVSPGTNIRNKKWSLGTILYIFNQSDSSWA